MKAPSSTIPSEAHDAATGPRNADYGHPADDFVRIAQPWSVVFNTPVTPEQCILAMICPKASREVHVPKRDNALDIAGCAWCLDAVNTAAGTPDAPAQEVEEETPEPAPSPAAKGDNPPKPTEEQVGVGGGWRPLDTSEIKERYDLHSQIWMWNDEGWDGTGWSGDFLYRTYRTKLSRTRLSRAKLAVLP